MKEKELINKYIRFIKLVAMKKNQPMYLDDLIQIGRISIIKANEKYIPNDNCSFLSYARIIIENDMNSFLSENTSTVYFPKSQRLKGNSIHIKSIDAPINDEGDTLVDLLPSSEPYIPIKPNEALREALSSLNPKQRKIIDMYFNLADDDQPMTIQQIADHYGVSKQNISLYIKRIISLLRVEMKVTGITELRLKNK